ncbi:MAG: hypothetical protein JWO83_635 [Caulobacteraceae bacterium]|nr:hypothetical protein [Caulobacteraceae bacterium]
MTVDGFDLYVLGILAPAMDAIYPDASASRPFGGDGREPFRGAPPQLPAALSPLEQRGVSVPDDLYGIDRPDEVAALYRSVFAWAKIDHPDLAAVAEGAVA